MRIFEIKTEALGIYFSAAFCFHAIGSVSYTHLDVYKRQIQKREKLQQLYNGSAESLVKFIGGYYCLLYTSIPITINRAAVFAAGIR